MEKYTFKRGFFQVFGLVLLALGISGGLVGGLGSGAVDAFAFGFYKLTGILDQGTWTFIVNGTLVIILILLTRKWRILLSVIVLLILTVAINLGISLYEWIFNFTFFDNVTGISNNLLIDGQLFNAIWVSILSLIVMAVGVALLIVHKGILSPYDEWSIFLKEKFNSYTIGKIVLDGTFLILGLVLGFINGRPFEQIGFFSIVLVMFLGPTTSLFLKIFNKNDKGEENNEIEQVY